MIKIEPPEGWEPPASASQVVEDSDLKEMRAQGPGTEATTDLDSKKTKGSSTGQTPSAKPQRQVVVGKKKQPGKKQSSSKQPTPSKEQPVLPNDQWTNQSSRQKQKVVFLICSAAGLLIVVLAVIGFLVSKISNNRNLAQDNSGDKVDVANPDPGGNDNPISKDKAKDADISDKKKAEVKDKKKVDKKEFGKVDPADDKTKKDDDKTKKDIAKKNNVDDGKNGKKAGGNNPTLISGSPDGKGDGLAKKGDGSRSPEEKDGTGPSLEQNQSILDRLGDKMKGVLSNSVQDLRSDSFNIDHDSQIGIGSIYIPKPREMTVKVDSWLGSKVHAISIPEMPLNQFLRTISIGSNLPIKLDIDAMIYKGIDHRALVKFEGESTTFQLILEQTLQPLGLEFEKKEWGVLVLPTKLDEIIEREYEFFQLDDESDEKYEEVAAFIKTRFAPKSWLETGGAGDVVREGRKFRIKNTAKVHYWIGRYFDRINRSRTESKKESDKKSLPTLLVSANDGLNVSSELDIIVAQPIRTVFAKVADETGVTISLDWPALMAEGWNPNTKITWEPKGKPLRVPLDQMVRSMKLSYRVIDPKTIQITSRRMVDNVYSLEIYSCALIRSKISEYQLRTQVLSAFGDQFDRTRGMSAMYYEPAQCIVAVLPQPLHKRLERILEIIESDKK